MGSIGYSRPGFQDYLGKIGLWVWIGKIGTTLLLKVNLFLAVVLPTVSQNSRGSLHQKNLLASLEYPPLSRSRTISSGLAAPFSTLDLTRQPETKNLPKHHSCGKLPLGGNMPPFEHCRTTALLEAHLPPPYVMYGGPHLRGISELAHAYTGTRGEVRFYITGSSVLVFEFCFNLSFGFCAGACYTVSF